MEPSHFELRPEQLLAHAGWIRNLALQLAQDASAAEDLVQETWLAALRSRPDGRWPLHAWLGRVLRTQALLARRRGGARVAREAVGARGEALPSAEELAMRAEAQRLVVQAVLGLEEPYRSVIVLCYYEGLRPADIARRRGISPSTLRSQLHRGRERLREQLDADFGGSSRRWMSALAPLAGSRAPRGALPRGGLLVAWPGRAVLGVLVAAAACAWLASDTGSDRGIRALQPARDAASIPATRLASLASGSETPGRAATSAGFAAHEHFTIRLVDEDTGEPLPHYELAVSSPGGMVASRTTDPTGVLRLPWVSGQGAWKLELIDEPRLLDRESDVHGSQGLRRAPVRSLWLDPAADETLAVAAGPTYRLVLEVPAGLEWSELHAHLRSHQPNFFTQRWQEHQAPVRAPRGGGEPWVRFAPLEGRFIGAEPPWILEIFSSDGLWSGAAPVETVRGMQAERVVVELLPQSRLTGSVRDALGPVTEDVALTFLDAQGAVAGLACDTDGAGRYASGSLEPGNYRLRAVTPRHATREVEIVLRGGEIQSLDVWLERAAMVGSVEGVLASRSGTYDRPVLVLLESDDAKGRRFFGRSAWEGTPGSRQSPFQFPDVPAGRYTLHVLSFRDQLPWEPSGLSITAPAAGLRLQCLDDSPRTDLAFHALDAGTGELLSEFTIVYAAEGGPQIHLRRVRAAPESKAAACFQWEVFCAGLVWTHSSGPAQIQGIASGRRLHWSVFAPGRAPRFGDEGDFASRDGLGLAQVALEPGWGLRMRVTDAGSRAPLAGAELWVDGRACSRSDSGGVLAASLPGAPTQLDVRLIGWQQSHSIDPASLAPHLWLEVPMARR